MTNQLELTYRVNLSELELQLEFPESSCFAQQMEMTIHNPYPELMVRYTTDGSDPHSTSEIYKDPFQLYETTTVKAAFFDKSGWPRSGIVEKTFEKLTAVPAIQPTTHLSKGLQYQYYEGNFEKLPVFENLTPKKKGIALDFEVDKLANQEDHFAILYEGYFDAPAKGLYVFSTHSDDGSGLYVHHKLVVDNDGSHSARRKEGKIALEKGLHPIRIVYFEDYEGESLKVRIKGPGEMEQLLDFNRLLH